MQVPDSVRLEVKVTHAYAGERREWQSEAEAFWQPLIQQRRAQLSSNSPEEVPTMSALESRLAAALPRRLRLVLAQYFNPAYPRSARGLEEPISATALSTKSASLVPLVGLSVASIRYGSLDLSIEITGVKHLLELFDSNFDLFMMFAQSYLPVAFAEAMQEIKIPTSDFSFQIAPSPKLVSAFASASVPSQPAPTLSVLPASAPNAGSSTSDRMKAIWQITNFSLLVPVALSLLVLYVAAKSLSDERNELKEWRKELSAREQANARAAQDRLSQLEKVQSDLVTLLRDPAQTTVKKK